MQNKRVVFLERLSALRTRMLRQSASMHGVQTIHAEILEYLSRCNKYSNTAQALSEYLGITKGSISQSLKTMEKNGVIAREKRPDDKRYIKIFLTDKGAKLLRDLLHDIPMMPKLDEMTEDGLQHTLRQWQYENNLRSFGLCRTCKFNENGKGNKFRCGLTEEALTVSDTKKICREHTYAELSGADQRLRIRSSAI